jgi:ketol-acid reductoisomerase
MMNSADTQVRVYRAADAPEGVLDGESVAVLGYGHLGRTAALNLRDSGAKVRIGNREDEYARQARAEGFEVVPIAAAAADDVVFVLLPDEVIPAVFGGEIAPALKPGSAIAFGSGYSLAFGLIHPPEAVDVLLVAPRMAGSSARARYVAGQGFWACIGVEADRSGRAQQRMLGLAAGLGVLRAGAIQMSAKMEATLDLFVEQTFGAVLGTAIMTAFEVARDDGIPAEALVLEMYRSGEMEAVFQAFRETGFFRSAEDHGPTAVFGGITRTMAMDRGAMTESFREILRDIKSGGFAQRFQEEAGNGYPMLEFARAMMHGYSPISTAEDRLRRLTSSDAGSSGGPSAELSNPMARQASIESTQRVAAGRGSSPSISSEPRTPWAARLIRAPGRAWTVWKHAPAGTPWKYKLVCAGVHLKALLRLAPVKYDFGGRVVLVTGAASGIGRATAEAFARAGAKVALTSRDMKQLEAIAEQLRSTGAKVSTHHLDVTDRGEAFAVIDTVAKEFGRLDILVNNAGIGQCLRLEDLQWEDTRKIVDTNLMGIIHCIQAALPIMKQQGSGQIVNVSSTAGHKGIPFLSVYCATKFAVRGLTESLRMELHKKGIELISVCPGTTDTNFFRRAITNGEGWSLKSPWTHGPDGVAERILHASARHKREVVLTPEGKMMVIINKFAPRLIDFMTLKVAAKE